MNSPVNICVVFAIISGDFVDDAPWMLRGRRIVEIDQRKSVHVLIQDGEVFPVLVG